MAIKFGRDGYNWKSGNPMDLNTDEPSMERSITQDMGRRNNNQMLRNQAAKETNPLAQEKVYNQQSYDGESPVGMNIDPRARQTIHNQARDTERGEQFKASHQGVSDEFARNIASILNDGRQLQQKYENQANGNYGDAPTMGQIAQQRMDGLPQGNENAWMKQNPFTDNMGYQWADDEKLRALGWGDDDIASMKARTEFHPMEINKLRSMGALRAPYAEYLAEQERLRQQALAEAAAAQASYSEPTYTYSEPVTYQVPGGLSTNTSNVSAYDSGGLGVGANYTGYNPTPAPAEDKPIWYGSLDYFKRS